MSALDWKFSHDATGDGLNHAFDYYCAILLCAIALSVEMPALDCKTILTLGTDFGSWWTLAWNRPFHLH